ncbi:MAG TPA: hypothetical protein VMT00_06120 [Thermoanaerobaculia bacterium]|nr:hypothetical protein [Thermoanaerobaculia bacterium]
MRPRRTAIAVLVLTLLAAAALPLHAGKQPGSKTPLVVTFRDCQDGFPSAAFLALHPGAPCPAAADRIGSDWKQPYVDGELGVEAFLGTQANSGNVLLNVKRSTRGLLLDFTECVSTGRCTPPPSQIYSLSSIRVDATAVRKNGLLGMAVHETLSVPARVQYQETAEQGPGFIDFDPNLGGKSPCKGASDAVSVTRTGVDTWEVIADPSRIGCVTLPDNAGWAGNYHFPFRFMVRIK